MSYDRYEDEKLDAQYDAADEKWQSYVEPFLLALVDKKLGEIESKRYEDEDFDYDATRDQLMDDLWSEAEDEAKDSYCGCNDYHCPCN